MMALEKLRRALEERKTIILKEPLVRKIAPLRGHLHGQVLEPEDWDAIMTFGEKIEDLAGSLKYAFPFASAAIDVIEEIKAEVERFQPKLEELKRKLGRR